MGDSADIIVETLKEKGRHAHEGYVLVGKDHKIVWINPHLEEKGYSLDHIKGQLYCKIFEGKEKLDESCSTVQAFKTGKQYKKYITGKDRKLYEITSKPIEVEGKIKYVLEVSKEILTKQPVQPTGKAHPASPSALPLQLVAKYCFDGIFITDEKKNCVYVNPAYEQLTGYISLELIGKTPSIFQKPPDGQGMYHQFKHAMKTGSIWSEKEEKKGKDGSSYHVETKLIPLKNSTGTITHFMGVEKNITSEQQLAREVEFYKSFSESTVNPVLQINYEEEYTIIMEKTKLFFRDKSIREILGPNISQVITQIKGKGDEKILPGEVEIEGRVYQVSVVDIPRFKRINFYFLDVTDLKTIEKKLRYKNEDLEKFYKVGVGRELKMIELKKRVETLEREIKKKEHQATAK